MNAGNRATELRGADRAEGLPGHCRLAVSRYGGPMGIYRKDSAEAHVAEGRDGGKPVAGALQDGKQFLLGDPRLGRNAGRSTEADPDRGQLMSGVDNQNVFAVPARNHQGRPIVSTTARAHSPTPAVSPIGDHNHVVGGRRNAGPKRFGTDLSGPVPKCLHVKTDGAREGGGPRAPHVVQRSRFDGAWLPETGSCGRSAEAHRAGNALFCVHLPNQLHVQTTCWSRIPNPRRRSDSEHS